MLGFTPFRYYYYMWKYVTPLLLLALLTASAIQLGTNPPSYRAWIQELVGPFKFFLFFLRICLRVIHHLYSTVLPTQMLWCELQVNYVFQGQDQPVSYPPWGLAVCITLVITAILPVPVVLVLRCFNVIDEKADGTSSISYKKGRIIKESVHRKGQEDEGDDTSLLQGKTPSEAPSPMPPNSLYRKQSSSTGQAEPASNGHFSIGYLIADMPDMPESDLWRRQVMFLSELKFRAYMWT